MNKEWKYIDWEQCPGCGSYLEGHTNAGVYDGNQHFYDGDEVRCIDDECEAKNLHINVEEDGTAWVGEDWE